MMRISFEDGLMMVMDDQNQGYDCFVLRDNCPVDEATEQIQRWATQYAFDVEGARRELAAYFDDLNAE